jgi:S1-C subfamily serine protease
VTDDGVGEVNSEQPIDQEPETAQTPAAAAPETAPTPVTPPADTAPIPMPPVSHPVPATPDYRYGPPPMGAPLPSPQAGPPPAAPVDAVVPGSSYALGALAGNPRLGSSGGSGYGGPPTDPGAPTWPGASGAPAAPGIATARHSHRLRNSALITGAAVIAVAAGVGIGHAAWKNNGSTPVASHSALPASPSFGSGGSAGGSSGSGSSGSSNSSGSSGPSDVSAIAAKVDPGLVDINTSLGYQQAQAAGTGIVLTSSGEILTNNHVINGATSISVTDVGNGKTYTASVVGYDRTRDIAVLQLKNASGLQTATIGDSSSASVGQDVVGIGNAGGTGGTPSAAGGTITALNQTITASDESGSSEQLNGLIETNADIQAGDSGGSLVNSSGQVIGIDTAASAGFSFQQPSGQSSGNQGFAIPINEAVSVARQIVAGTSSSTVHIGATAFLGVEVSTAASSQGGTGNSFGGGGFNGGSSNSGSSTSGAQIAGVVTSSPAQEAGLANGDVITSVNGQTVDSPTKLTTLMSPFHPGDKVTIGWTDTSGQPQTATVQLTSGPPQ